MSEFDWSALLSPSFNEISNGVTIADATQRERPLVFVNKAFERITGYSAEESVGRNCRFLQGEDTDPESIKKIRRALDRRERCHVIVRNYRKNGTAFLNELKIFPVPEEGEATHFIGIQNDVTAKFIALALQRRIQIPSQLVDELDDLQPSLDRPLDLDNLPHSLEGVGAIVSSPRGEILHADLAAKDILQTEGVGSSVLEVFEGAGLLDAFRPNPERARWFSARRRHDQAPVLLRVHRLSMPKLGQEFMVVLTCNSQP